MNNREFILLILLSILFVSGCSTNKIQKRTAWDYDKLKGRVKEMRVVSYKTGDTASGISNNQVISDFIVKYNFVGDWTEWRSFNSDRSKKWLEKPIYNQQGNVISRRDYSYNKSDSLLVRKFKYKNDNQGNIIETLCENSVDSLLWKQQFKYDKRGNVIEILKFATSDSLKWQKKCKYNHVNKIIEEVKYNVDTSLIGRHIYFYDNQWNRIKKVSYDKDNVIESQMIYIYNKQGDYIKIRLCLKCTFSTLVIQKRLVKKTEITNLSSVTRELN